MREVFPLTGLSARRIKAKAGRGIRSGCEKRLTGIGDTRGDWLLSPVERGKGDEPGPSTQISKEVSWQG